MSKKIKLNEDAWSNAIATFLSESGDFDGSRLVLDEKHSFDDLLQFDLVNFFGELDSKTTAKLEQRFHGLVEAKFNPDAHSSRQHVLTFTVRPPSPLVSATLVNLWNEQRRIFEARHWPTWLLLVLLVVSLGMIGHAAFMLHQHTTSKDNPFAVLLHNMTFQLAKLYFFANLSK